MTAEEFIEIDLSKDENEAILEHAGYCIMHENTRKDLALYYLKKEKKMDSFLQL